MARIYMVGTHEDHPEILDDDAAAMNVETLLSDIAEYCELRSRSDFSEKED